MSKTIIETSEGRAFEVTTDAGKKVSVRVRKPKREEIEGADFEFCRVYTQGLKHGLTPRSRMIRILRENDTWTLKDDENLNTLRETVARADNRLAELDEAIEKTEGTAKEALEVERSELENERTIAFRELQQLRMEAQELLSKTADAKAEESQRNYLLACITEYVTIAGGKVTKVGKRVWESSDKLSEETDINLMQRVIYEQMTYSQGLASEWEKDSENIATPPVTTPPADAPGDETKQEADLESKPEVTPA